jgi:WD40 repeat protein
VEKGSENSSGDNKSDRLYTVLTTGQRVVLDKDLGNTSEVTVISQTPKRLYTTITSNGVESWDVMTYRLSIL